MKLDSEIRRDVQNELDIAALKWNFSIEDDASRAAWAAPGVAKVENQLQVQY